MTDVPDLPPVPDGSGEPRPPAAPRVNGPWPIRTSDRRSEVIHHSDGTLARLGGSAYEALERVAIRRPDRWRAAGLSVLGVWGVPTLLLSIYAVVVGPASTVFLVLGGALAVVVPVTCVWALSGPRPYLVVIAGSRYVGLPSRDGDGQVAGLYWLSTIELRPTRTRGLVLRIAEPEGRPLDLPLGAVEANPQLWALVYNGIRHSVADGARVDERTRELLRLPEP